MGALTVKTSGSARGSNLRALRPLLEELLLAEEQLEEAQTLDAKRRVERAREQVLVHLSARRPLEKSA